MNKKILALCDSEEGYILRLGEVLEERSTFPFEVSVFTDIEMLKKEIKKGMIEAVLISDELVDSDKDIETNKLVILLDNGNRIVGGHHTIWKFQSGESIRRELLKAYSEYTQSMEGSMTKGDGRISLSHRETIIIGLYTPIGRCLQTSVAILLGQLLAKKRSVLYLNFEAFAGLRKILGCEDQKDITDLVYYMRGGANRLVYKLESLICNIGSLDYISPAASFVDLCSVDEEDWLTLINTIKMQSDYDYVILDLSEMVTGLFNVLKTCDLIYTITRKDALATAKLQQYENNLQGGEYEDVIAKTRRCEIPPISKLPVDITRLEASPLTAVVKSIVGGDLQDAI